MIIKSFRDRAEELLKQEINKDINQNGIYGAEWEEWLRSNRNKNDCPINNFGHLEWDVGTCADCWIENTELFNACWNETHKNIKPKLPRKILPECYGDYPDCCYLSSECECKEDCKQKENKN